MKNNYNEQHILKSSFGFTLVELLVAITIFGVVMIMISGILINAIREQRIVLAKQAIGDNALYTMESVIKELRMAKLITTTAGNGNNLTFGNSAGDSITYSLSNGQIMRNDATLATGNQPVSSNEITISGLNFSVNNWDSTHAPRITIFMRAQEATSSSSQTSLEIQTTVSPRLY